MKKLGEFDIEIIKLSPGIHEFKFKVGSGFFKKFDYGLIEKGDLIVKVVLEKHVHLINAKFEIEGEVELTCDRSLEKFNHPLSLQNELVVKFGDEEDVLADDVIVVKYDEPVLNVAIFIYEYITVAIPLKKIHPKFRDENENDVDQLIYTSGEEEDTGENSSNGEIDPRWKELLKLKNKKK